MKPGRRPKLLSLAAPAVIATGLTACHLAHAEPPSSPVETLLLENRFVSIFRVVLPPGGSSPVREHPDRVVVAMTDSSRRIEGRRARGGERRLAAGDVAWEEAGVLGIGNMSKRSAELLLVELKRQRGARHAWLLPEDHLDARVQSVALENAYVRVLR